MALVGDLGSVDLAQVFQVLAQNQKDGVLEIYRGNEHRGLRFRRGTVTLQFERDLYEDRAIELLTLLGRISEEKLQLAAANRSGSDAAVLEVLVEMKILTDEEIISLFRERMAEELYDLFSWSDGRFEFHEGAARLDNAAGVIDDRLCFPPDALVMEAARRLDEWSRIRATVPDDDEVFVPTVDELNPEDDLQAAVFVEADGSRSVKDIHRRVGRSRFEVTKALSQLVQRGSLAALAPAEYPSRGQAARGAGRHREAANLFDRAAAAGVDMPASLGHAAESWEASGDRMQAADRYVAFANALDERQDYEEALVKYRKAHDLVATHVEAWRKVVLLSLDLEVRDGHSRAELHPRRTRAHELAQILLEIGQTSQAVEVLEKLLAAHPKDLEIKRTLIGALENGGNPARLAELLESLAQDLTNRGDTVAAAASLQRVLRVQPHRKDVSAKIKELYKRDANKRSAFKLVWVLGLSAILTGGVAFLLYAREERAKADLAAIDIDSAIAAEEFDKARLVLREFKESHPFTFTLDAAAKKLASVEAAHAAVVERESKRKATETEARKKRQDEATSLAAKADSDARSGNLPAALAGLRKALAAAPPDWEQAADVLRNANDLEAYLSAATKVAAVAEERLAARDFAAARNSVKELTVKFPRSPEGTIARFPVEVKSTPPGASVELAGAAPGEPLRTPAVLLLAPSRKPYTVAVKLEGHEPAILTVDPAKDGSFEVKLGRAAAVAFALPGVHSGNASVTEERMVVGVAGGRVAAYSSKGAPLWNVVLSAGGELVGPPLDLGSHVIVASTDGAVESIDAASGRVGWRIETSQAFRVPPLATPEGVVIALDDGRVRLLDPESGDRRREWRSGARPAGNLARDGGRLFVGGTDGRVRVLDFANPRTDERSIVFGSPVSSLTIAGERLVIAGDDGRLAAYDFVDGNGLWNVPGGRIAAMKPAVDGDRIIVERDGRLASLDVKSGVEGASSPAGLPPVSAFALTHGSVFAVFRDGTAAALDAGDLSLSWRWPGAPDRATAPPRDRREAAPPVCVAAGGASAVAILGKSLFRFEIAAALGESRPAATTADPSQR